MKLLYSIGKSSDYLVIELSRNLKLTSTFCSHLKTLLGITCSTVIFTELSQLVLYFTSSANYLLIDLISYSLNTNVGMRKLYS